MLPGRSVSSPISWFINIWKSIAIFRCLRHLHRYHCCWFCCHYHHIWRCATLHYIYCMRCFQWHCCRCHAPITQCGHAQKGDWRLLHCHCCCWLLKLPIAVQWPLVRVDLASRIPSSTTRMAIQCIQRWCSVCLECKCIHSFVLIGNVMMPCVCFQVSWTRVLFLLRLLWRPQMLWKDALLGDVSDAIVMHR